MGLRPSPEVGTGRGALPSPPGSSARRGCSSQYPILRGRLLLRAFIPWTVAWSLPSGRRPVRAAAPHPRLAGLVPCLAICRDQLRGRPGVGARGPARTSEGEAYTMCDRGATTGGGTGCDDQARDRHGHPVAAAFLAAFLAGRPALARCPCRAGAATGATAEARTTTAGGRTTRPGTLGGESPGQRGHPWLPGTSATGGCSCPSA